MGPFLADEQHRPRNGISGIPRYADHPSRPAYLGPRLQVRFWHQARTGPQGGRCGPTGPHRQERADTEHSTRYLRSLLSTIQEDAGYPAVAAVEIANPFNLQDTEDAKLSVVDVRATDVNGIIFTVEAQSTNHRAFGSRVLYYWAKTYGAQLREGDFYTTLKPVVGMHLLDFRLFPEEVGAPPWKIPS